MLGQYRTVSLTLFTEQICTVSSLLYVSIQQSPICSQYSLNSCTIILVTGLELTWTIIIEGESASTSGATENVNSLFQIFLRNWLLSGIVSYRSKGKMVAQKKYKIWEINRWRQAIFVRAVPTAGPHLLKDSQDWFNRKLVLQRWVFDSISTKQDACLCWEVNKASCLSGYLCINLITILADRRAVGAAQILKGENVLLSASTDYKPVRKKEVTSAIQTTLVQLGESRRTWRDT